MIDEIYPLLLTPVVLDKPWGQRGFGPRLVPGTAPEMKVGEIWLTRDDQEDDKTHSAHVINGPCAGHSLADLRYAHGTLLLGNRFRTGQHFPLPILLKLLHSAEYLSVQVHPSDQTAKALEGAGSGKTEAWYILHVEDNAEIIMGMKPGLDAVDLKLALQKGNTPELLESINPKAGDVFYIHSGCIHAIGPGVTLFEIQQNADITYRLYDWDRVDGQGRPRELHIDKALASVDFDPIYLTPFRGHTWTIPTGRTTMLAAGRYFALERWDLDRETRLSSNTDRFDLLSILEGNGSLAPDNGSSPMDLQKGDTVLIPAALGGYGIIPQDSLTLLHSWVPNLETEIVEPLRAKGFSDHDIAMLAGPRRPNDLTAALSNEPWPRYRSEK